jgi:beta-glucanase (GH16 family)
MLGQAAGITRQLAKSFKLAQGRVHDRNPSARADSCPGGLGASIQVPDTANGIWPAFWMLGDNYPAVVWPKCGEVDILEIGGKEGIRQGLQHRQINCALHYAGKNERKVSLVEWHNASIDLHKDFHIYKLDWTPQSMRFFLDEREFGAGDISGPEFREYHQPFFPILNVAVGSWTSSYTAVDTPDKVEARFPARMRVDWVRQWANSYTKVLLKRQPVPAGGRVSSPSARRFRGVCSMPTATTRILPTPIGQCSSSGTT